MQTSHIVSDQQLIQILLSVPFSVFLLIWVKSINIKTLSYLPTSIMSFFILTCVYSFQWKWIIKIHDTRTYYLLVLVWNSVFPHSIRNKPMQYHNSNRIKPLWLRTALQPFEPNTQRNRFIFYVNTNDYWVKAQISKMDGNGDINCSDFYRTSWLEAFLTYGCLTP